MSATVAYLFGGVMLYMFLWYFYKPLKWVAGIAFKTVCGGVGLILFNLLSDVTGVSLGINPVTAFTTGVLGVPGIILLTVLKITL